MQLDELLERLERLEDKLESAVDRVTHEDHGGDEALRYCSIPKTPPRTFAPDVSPDRARLIRMVSRKWVNGTTLHYWFFDSGPNSAGDDQKDLVREGFGEWEKLKIGIKFEEVQDISEAEIRIGFLRGDGAWSFVGRDVIDIPGQGERTMNFGWDLRTDPRRVDVPVHEIGHTLGFPHEHQNPFAGIVWNEQAVIDFFGGSPNNWSPETTRHNILDKLPSGDVRGSQWDPDSIMHYAFAAGLIDKPEKYRNGLNPRGGLSDHDIEEVRFFYPPIDDSGHAELKAFRSESLSLAPAEQKNYVINPPATRDYAIQTFGQSDVVMVLFEDQNGNLKYVDGDDDSGTPRNSQLKVRLFQGKRYVLRIRLMAVSAAHETAVMLW
ncbi:MAG: M12 family metallopeptidase [Planctomycetaceae bacterium]